jgi:hypothetical protein
MPGFETVVLTCVIELTESIFFGMDVKLVFALSKIMHKCNI